MSARPILRSLINEFNYTFADVKTQAKWKEILVHEFKKCSNVNGKGDGISAAAMEADAQEYLTMLTSTREHQKLLDLYFPSSDMTERERVKKSANLVGLELPEYIDEKKDVSKC